MGAPQTVDDCRDYFYGVIDKAMGQPADDWEAVLTACGIPAGNPPGVKSDPDVHWGFTQQVGAAGVRGRLFLPTDQPDSLGYYTHPIDLFDSRNGRLYWAWHDNLGGPPYAPQDGGGSILPPIPEAPGEGAALTVAAVQRMIDEQCVTWGSKAALRLNSGKVVGVVGGGPQQDDRPIQLISKTDIHAWETLTVERGEG